MLSPPIRFFLFLFGVPAAIFAIYYWWGTGEYPRYIAYKIRVNLIVEGEPVAVEGNVECTRRSFAMFLGHQYDFSTNVLLKHLDSGAAVLVGGLGYCLHLLGDDPDLTPDDMPAIFWMDNPTRPDTVEFYAYQTINDSPEARVQIGSIDIVWHEERSLSFAFMEFVLEKDVHDQMPWLESPDRNHLLIGFQATIVGEKELSEQPALLAALGKYTKATIINDLILKELGAEFSWMERYIFHQSGCLYRSDRYLTGRCSWVPRTYGMIPIQSPPGAILDDVNRTLGFIRFSRLETSNLKTDGYRIDIYNSIINTKYNAGSTEIYIPDQKKIIVMYHLWAHIYIDRMFAYYPKEMFIL